MWWLLLLSVLGCASQTPIVEGTHFPLAQTTPLTIAVTGDPPEAVHAAVMLLQRLGHRVVADAKQAEQMIVVHATVAPEIFGLKGGFIDTSYRLSVVAHGIDIATGHILWASQARYAHTVGSPPRSLPGLIASAIFGQP